MSTELQLAWEGLERGGWARRRPAFPDAVNIKAFTDHEYGLHTPKALAELEVECALDAAWEAGYEAAVQAMRRTQASAGAAEVSDTEAKRFAERQRIKIELARAVAQAIASLSNIVDETGGIR